MVLFITSMVIVYKVCISSWSYLLHQWWLRTRFVWALGPIYYINGDCVHSLYELLVLFITSTVIAYKVCKLLVLSITSMVIAYTVCMSSCSYLLHQWWLRTRFVWALGPIYYINGDCVHSLYELLVLFITSMVIAYKVCMSSWSYLLHQWWLRTQFV